MPVYLFIVVSLGDTDFAEALKAALEVAGPVCVEKQLGESDLKGIVSLHMVASAMQKQSLQRQTSSSEQGRDSAPDWAGIQKLERYLWERLEVRFCRHAPDVDHPQGSAYYDVAQQQVYLY